MTDDAPGPPLTSVELKVLSHIERTWHLSGTWPSLVQLRELFPDFSLSSSLMKTTFKTALDNRGLPLPSNLSQDEKTGVLKLGKNSELTDAQMAAILSLTNFSDRRSHQTKLKDLGITPTRYRGWLKNGVFVKTLQQLSGEQFDTAINQAHTGLLASVDKGNVDAIKLFLEMTGRFTSGSNNVESQNFNLVIARLMEAIQRVVKDPELLRQLGQEFEMIMSGQPVRSVDTRLPIPAISPQRALGSSL